MLDPDDDGDQLGDSLEIEIGTDPVLFDSDGDGYSDSVDELPMDSTDWKDSDGDGVGDKTDFAPSIARYQSNADVAVDLAIAILGIFSVALVASMAHQRINARRENSEISPIDED